tara:strand:- start:2003 stop:2464 length:462 start_codon:yes stop_codon:yes gene_type:complete
MSENSKIDDVKKVELKNTKTIEKYEDDNNKPKTDFDIYMNASDRLSKMQQHLVTHIGLSMGVVSTIVFISNTKTFISSYLKYIIIGLMIYSFMLAITGLGEYTEKYVQFVKYKKFDDVTLWDFILSIIYFLVGMIMVVIIILLFISLTKEKLV